MCKKEGGFEMVRAGILWKRLKFTTFSKLAHGLRSFAQKTVELPVRAWGNRTVARVLVIPAGKC